MLVFFVVWGGGVRDTLCFARPQRLVLTKGAGMGKHIKHAYWFMLSPIMHHTHTHLHCMHDVLPEQESVQADQPILAVLDNMAAGAEQTSLPHIRHTCSTNKHTHAKVKTRLTHL